jgi:hypothetical protein
MIQTNYGTFDGDSWEDLCQLVFKSKYKDKQYQEMVASPGDFGIEGFTKLDGVAFQCYCPDNHYTQKELYEKQRDKITKDLEKLRTYEKEIARRLGTTTLKEWVFVTPKITDNNLLKHAQTKQEEIVGWGLSIIHNDFKVIIQDADFFAKEINEIQTVKGSKITLFSVLDLANSTEEQDVTVYEENISRKNKVRCTFNGSLNEEKHLKLNLLTSKKWLESDSFLKDIEKKASEIYFQVMRVVSQYESEVEELCITWQGEAEDLIFKVRDELALRIEEAIPALGEAERYRLSDQMTSKWLALCPLGIE